MPETPMPLWTAREIAAATGGRIEGGPFDATGLTYTSREIGPGDLFLALKGARDGHDFAAAAFAAGASGGLVEHAVADSDGSLQRVQAGRRQGPESDL